MNTTRNEPISYWIDECGEILPRQKLNGSINVDVAVLGAGFTGLWTAYYLLKQDPTLKIVVLEKETTGFGASGRNGGWCSPKFSVTPGSAIKRYGLDTARDLQYAMHDSVEEIGRVINEESIDADWELGGSLQVALGEYGLPSIEKSMDTYKKFGMEDLFELLNEEQTNERVKVQGAKGSLFTKKSAVLNPGKLVRQLADILEARGVQIFEQTEVLDVVEGDINQDAQLITKNGNVSAKKAVVLAGEAYMIQMPKFKRNLVPMYSLITITEPLSDEQWEAIGWNGRETIGSTRLSIDYLQKTIDGRILIGGRGQPYRFGSKISRDLDYHEKTHQALKERLMQWFPALNGVRFTHDWGGPVGISRDWTPNFKFDQRTKVASAWGFAGQGVSTANLAGRILSDLLFEKDTAITNLPMVQHQSKKWEPEPFRWIGVRYVQSALGAVDEKAQRTGKPPSGKSIAERLSKN